jgi:hypothetical protein
MAFFCRGDQIRYAIKDMSFLASSHTVFPHSLGVRPQVLKLRFVSPELEARFFSPNVPLKKVMDSVDKQFHSADNSHGIGPVLHRAFIGEAVSLIFSPVFIERDQFHDGVLPRPIGRIPENYLDDLLPFERQSNWQINFLPTLCPLCGWDLHGERDSVILFCRNCNSAWGASKRGFVQIDFGVIPGKGEADFYLPFWKMRVGIEGLRIQTFGDLLRMAHLPKVIHGGFEELDLHFWAPAFKAPPGLFLRLTKQMTISQLQEEVEASLPKSSLYPVTLPLSEAAETIKVALADIVIDQSRTLPRLDQIEVQLNQSHLIYLAFVLTGSDFIQIQTRHCIPKNSLRIGRYL